MSLTRLIWNNITGSGFRSGAVVICAALVAALALTATFVVRGAQENLRSSMDRLGADLVVIPWGLTNVEELERYRLMSLALDADQWIPRAYIEKVAQIEGVAEVSPQLFLSDMQGSPYSSEAELYLAAFDPVTDFTLQPWLTQPLEHNISNGEALAGSSIITPDETGIVTLYGYPVTITGRLEPTGTDIDKSIFVSFATANELAVHSQQVKTWRPIKIAPDTISVIMVKMALDSDPHDVAVRIMEQVSGVVPLESAELFQTERLHLIGLLRTFLGLLVTTWIISVVFIGLIYAIAVNERRQQIGVLRALGSTGSFVFKSFLIEGALLALAGGVAGNILVTASLSFFEETLALVIGIPMIIPEPQIFLSFSMGGLILAMFSVTLGAWLPAWRISHEDAAIAMRG